MPIQETPNHKLRYPEGGDPAKHALYYKNLADDVERELDDIDIGTQLAVPGSSDGKLVIVKDGAAAYKAMSGDGTIDEDGVFQLGSKVVGTGELGDKAVTTAKVDDGAVTPDKTVKATREALGLSSSEEVRRGKSIIATEESRTNTSYGLLTTPDRVQNIVLPEGGLIYVLYSALWEVSSSEAGRAAIFVGSEQYRARVRVPTGASPAILAAQAGSSGGMRPLASAGVYGIASGNDQTANADSSTMGIGVGVADSNKTTMRVGAGESETIEIGTEGGFTVITAPPGTYDVSVQFRSTSGTVKVKSRKLYVWTQAF